MPSTLAAAGVRHRDALFVVGGDDGFGGGRQHRFEAPFLALHLADVVLNLLGHVVEGLGHLAQLVVALDGYGGDVVSRGHAYGRVARLEEGT
jgi:hypothetical protein